MQTSETKADLKQAITYTFKYETDGDSLDIMTLLGSQLPFQTILQAIKDNIASNTKLSLRIRPLERGSVPFDIILDVNWIESLFGLGKSVLPIAADIVSTLVDLLELKKAFSSNKEKIKVNIDNDRVTVEVGQTKIIVSKAAYELSNKPDVDKKLTEAFKVIEEDEDVNGVSILDARKYPLIEIPRSDFHKFTMPGNNVEEKSTTELKQKVLLSITKAVFEEGGKWQFVYQGRKIQALITDKNFIEGVNLGEPFAKGDRLEVDMEILKVMDKSLQVLVEKSFTILKVHTHQRRPNYNYGEIFS